MSPKWASYVVSELPGWLQNAKYPKFEKWAAITPKRYKIGCQLLLITNRKFHTAFDWYRSRWPWMTLNGVIALILHFFPPYLIALPSDYVTVVEDRPIMSVKYCLPVPAFHFWPKLTHPAARSLCDSWASCTASTLLVAWLTALKHPFHELGKIQTDDNTEWRESYQ